MIDSISKPKLQKGLSYLLKTSQLESALAGIECHVNLSYWTPQNHQSPALPETGQLTFTILDAHYWLPNARIPHSRFYVRAGSTPSYEHQAANEALVKEVFPAFRRWVIGIVNLPVDSPARHDKPYFQAVYRNGEVEISHDVDLAETAKKQVMNEARAYQAQ